MPQTQAEKDDYKKQLNLVITEMASLGHPVVIVPKTGGVRDSSQQAKIFSEGKSQFEGAGTRLSSHQIELGNDLMFESELKANIDKTKLPYKLLGEIAKKHGLTWGGDWKIPAGDFRHVESAAFKGINEAKQKPDLIPNTTINLSENKPMSQTQVIDPKKWEDVVDPNKWEDVSSDDKKKKLNPLERVVAGLPQEDNRGFLRKAYDTATTPLTDAPSRWAKSFSDWITTPELDDWKITAQAKGFMGGAMQGIGDLVSGMTSPLDLGATALTLGSNQLAKSGYRGAAYATRQLSRATGAPVAAHGLGNVGNAIFGEGELSDIPIGLAELAGGSLAMNQPKKPRVKLSTKPNLKSDISDMVGEIKRGTPPDIKQTSLAALADNASKADDLIKNFNIGRKEVPREMPESWQKLSDDTGSVNINEPKGTGTTIILKNPSVENVRKAYENGYEFKEVAADGKFKLVHTGSQHPPILEADVERMLARPTGTNVGRVESGIPPKVPRTKDIDLTDKGPIPKKPKEQSKLLEAYNFPRAVMASMDFSAPLRQGLPLIHKKQFWTSLSDMFRSWKSEAAYNGVMDDIMNRPLFKTRRSKQGSIIPSFAEEAGLKLTDLKSLSTREEMIMNNWAEKVPGVRRSNRAYTAFLNKLRADTFDDLVRRSKVFGANAEANLPLARSIAEFVNTASGRGSLGKLEKSAVTLNSILFSPRLIASRLGMFHQGAKSLFSPETYMAAGPNIRREYLKSLLSVAAVGNTVSQLAKLAGAEVSYDPTNTDFGKAKIGNTRLDPYGGFQQYIVAASKLLSGKSTSSTSGRVSDLDDENQVLGQSRGSIALNMLRGKSHPVIGFAWSLLDKKREMTGEKMNFSTPNPFDNSIAQRFIPILIQDIYAIAQDDPSLLPLSLLVGLGMSTQTYENKR